MKLDYNCIRHILLTIESDDSQKLTVSSFCTDEYPPKIISGHIQCLLDTAYIETGMPMLFIGSKYPDFIVNRITMQGHEYLNTVRDNKVWAETLNKIGKSAASVSLEIVKDVAASIIKASLGI